eukprot:gene51017-68295_t
MLYLALSQYRTLYNAAETQRLNSINQGIYCWGDRDRDRDRDREKSKLPLKVQNISLSGKFQITANAQSSASFFCKRPPAGFGYLPMLTRFDPTTFIRSPMETLTALLVPTEGDIRKAHPLLISGERPAFQKFNKTEAHGVDDMTIDALKRFHFVSNGQKNFGSRGLSVGVAAPMSYNDAHVRVNSLLVAGLENKGSEASLLPAVAQSAVSATNY